MERRKFVIGAGALATGSAAAMGTGAFASVRAERSLDIQTTGDDSAYLGLEVESPDYASETEDGTLEVQMDELNANADTGVYNVFSIKNNGNNDVQIELNPGGESFTALPDGPLAVYFSDDKLEGPSIAGLTAFPSSPSPDYVDAAAPNEQIVIESGENLYVHLIVYLNEELDELDASTDIDDIPDNLGIYVDGTPEDDFN